MRARENPLKRTEPSHRDASAPLPARRLTEGARRRVAMLRWAAAGIAVAVMGIGIVEYVYGNTPRFRIPLDTAWWCLLACIPAALLVDRFIHTPATEGSIWIAFSTGAMFVALIVFFGATHALYSRAVMLASFVVATSWLMLGVRLRVSGYVLRLGVCEVAVLDLLAAAQKALASPVTNVRAELIPSMRLDELAQLDGVVIDRYSIKDEAMQRLVSALKLDGVRIYSADHVHELLTGRLSLQHTEDSFLDDSSGQVLYGMIKRALDLIGAATLLALLGIPMLAVALAIRVTSRGPALFRQRRVGLHGRTFEMYKFRTMHATLATHGSVSPLDDARRVTRLGPLLRRYRIDELPQLLNVLGGSMSLIGPRPEWVETAEEFFEHIAHYPYRHLVRPGITGWAQVNQGHVTGVSAATIKLELDLYYVKHRSFALDLVIGIRTLRTVLTGFGAK